MICGRCNKEISPEEAVPHGQLKVCEDCAMDLLSPAKPCDPWAVKLATGAFSSKADAANSLLGVEKALYELVKDRRKIPSEEAARILGLEKDGVQKPFSVLRHMELLRGAKRTGGGIDFMLFDDRGYTD
jgi:hypothetical protein